MIGGFRFALARAGASRAVLVTLAAVIVVAAALVAIVAGAIQTAETREVQRVLAEAPGDTGRLILRGVDEAEVRAELAEHGVSHLVIVEDDGGRVGVRPDTAVVSSTDLAALIDAVDAIDADQRIGGLDATLARVDAALVAQRGPAAVAAALIAVMVAVVVAAVGADTVRARASENHLLRARGARRRTLVGFAVLEAAVIGLLAALVGTALGAGFSALVGESASPVLLAVIALAIAVVVVATVGFTTWRGSDRTTGRARAAVDIGALVILAVVTGLAAWRFVEAGSPVVERSDGGVTIDPLVAVAPALVLVLAALVALVVATPIARGITASLTRTRGVFPVTPLRLASRRPGRHALSIITVSFAIGALTVASLFQATTAALGDAPEQLRVGADVRVGTIPDDVDLDDIAALQPSDGSMAVRPVIGRTSDGRASVLAVDAANLGAVMSDPGGRVDPAGLAAAIALGDVGVPIEGDTLTISIHAEVPATIEVEGQVFEGPRQAVIVSATVIDASGRTEQLVQTNYDSQEVEFENGDTWTRTDVRPDTEQSFSLPEGEWRLIAIDSGPKDFYTGDAAVVVAASDVKGELDLSAWGPVLGAPGGVEVVDSGLRFLPDLASSTPAPTRAVADRVPSPAPVVITAALATSLSFETGDTFSLELDSPDMVADFTVAEIVPLIPGTTTGEGILVDLLTLSLLAPEPVVPNQLWMSSTSPTELAAAVEQEFPQTVTVIADPDADRAALAATTGFVIAAIGAAVLALLVLILRRTRSRADAHELAIFAVLGLGRARASRVRATEDVFAVVMGALGGLAAGALTGLLVVPPLVRASFQGIPSTYPVPLHVDVLVLGIGVLVAVSVFCVVAATVRAPASLAPILREDE